MSDPSKTIPTSESTSEIWINWHKTLRQWFSKNEANAHWLRFWQQRAGAGTRADDSTLRDYMRDQGVDLTTTTWGGITDSANSIVDWFGDTITMIRNLVIGAVVLGFALIAFYVISSTRKGKSAGEMVLDVRSLGKLAK